VPTNEHPGQDTRPVVLPVPAREIRLDWASSWSSPLRNAEKVSSRSTDQVIFVGDRDTAQEQSAHPWRPAAGKTRGTAQTTRSDYIAEVGRAAPKSPMTTVFYFLIGRCRGCFPRGLTVQLYTIARFRRSAGRTESQESVEKTWFSEAFMPITRNRSVK